MEGRACKVSRLVRGTVPTVCRLVRRTGPTVLQAGGVLLPLLRDVFVLGT